MWGRYGGEIGEMWGRCRGDIGGKCVRRRLEERRRVGHASGDTQRNPAVRAVVACGGGGVQRGGGLAARRRGGRAGAEGALDPLVAAADTVEEGVRVLARLRSACALGSGLGLGVGFLRA